MPAAPAAPPTPAAPAAELPPVPPELFPPVAPPLPPLPPEGAPAAPAAPELWGTQYPRSVPQRGSRYVSMAQRSDAQSNEDEQYWPSAQAGQSRPPQSRSVSVPFQMASVQLGAMHVPASHVTPAPQSASFTQVQLPSHASQAPPQSTSVSSPSITPLLQLAGTQWLQCDEHWSLAQSTS